MSLHALCICNLHWCSNVGAINSIEYLIKKTFKVAEALEAQPGVELSENKCTTPKISVESLKRVGNIRDSKAYLINGLVRLHTLMRQ